MRTKRIVGQVFALALFLGAAAWLPGCGGNVWPNAGFVSQYQQGTQNYGANLLGPCDVSASRRFVRITMQNTSPSYIHYHMHLVAEAGPSASICEDEIEKYTAFGYVQLPAGEPLDIGGVTFRSIDTRNSWLWYYHDNGRFRVNPTDTNSALLAGIAPAQAGSTSFDTFWINRVVPLPEYILFDDRTQATDTNECNHIAFYYVNAAGQAIRPGVTTDQVQGTRCECLGRTDATQAAMPINVSDTDAACFQYPRGARIIFTFIQQDTLPPVPQLVWNVLSPTGIPIHSPPSGAGL